MPDGDRGGTTYATAAELRALETTVESQIKGLAQSVNALADAVAADRKIQEDRDKSMRDALDSFAGEVRAEMKDDRRSRRLPSGTVVALIVAIIAAGGAAAALITSYVSPIKEAAGDHYHLPGHPESREKLMNHDGRILKNETELGHLWTDPIVGAFSMAYWKGQTDERLRWIQDHTLLAPALDGRVSAIEANRFTVSDAMNILLEDIRRRAENRLPPVGPLQSE